MLKLSFYLFNIYSMTANIFLKGDGWSSLIFMPPYFFIFGRERFRGLFGIGVLLVRMF